MPSAQIASGDFTASASVYVPNSAISEAAEALTVLGYDKNTALTILKGIDPTITDTGEIIRLALKKLAR